MHYMVIDFFFIQKYLLNAYYTSGSFSELVFIRQQKREILDLAELTFNYSDQKSEWYL